MGDERRDTKDLEPIKRLSVQLNITHGANLTRIVTETGKKPGRPEMAYKYWIT